MLPIERAKSWRFDSTLGKFSKARDFDRVKSLLHGLNECSLLFSFSLSLFFFNTNKNNLTKVLPRIPTKPAYLAIK
jgi:hypothetical protein